LFCFIMIEPGNRTAWQRDARDGGSRNERTSAGRSSGGASDAKPGQVSFSLSGEKRERNSPYPLT
jgi:hypothetical protein